MFDYYDGDVCLLFWLFIMSVVLLLYLLWCLFTALRLLVMVVAFCLLILRLRG